MKRLKLEVDAESIVELIKADARPFVNSEAVERLGIANRPFKEAKALATKNGDVVNFRIGNKYYFCHSMHYASLEQFILEGREQVKQISIKNIDKSNAEKRKARARIRVPKTLKADTYATTLKDLLVSSKSALTFSQIKDKLNYPDHRVKSSLRHKTNKGVINSKRIGMPVYYFHKDNEESLNVVIEKNEAAKLERKRRDNERRKKLRAEQKQAEIEAEKNRVIPVTLNVLGRNIPVKQYGEPKKVGKLATWAWCKPDYSKISGVAA